MNHYNSKSITANIVAKIVANITAANIEFNNELNTLFAKFEVIDAINLLFANKNIVANITANIVANIVAMVSRADDRE
jgi:hypothetical protein